MNLYMVGEFLLCEPIYGGEFLLCEPIYGGGVPSVLTYIWWWSSFCVNLYVVGELLLCEPIYGGGVPSV